MINLLRAGVAAMIGLAVLLGVSFMSGRIQEYDVPLAEKPVSNPLKGWAPWISTRETAHPATLEFVLWTWKDIEPQEGVYEFAALEEELGMDLLRQQGKRFIIRIVSDYPTEEKHMDIPQWLYDKTYGDGTWYDNSYGRGYAPDYNNPVLTEAHKELIEAFAAYYQDDPSLAWVELGSLGHWGEWHVKASSGITPFPGSAVSDRYVKPYIDGFEAGRLLLRRPFAIGAEEGMGLYNDSFGNMESHLLWLDWIENGYTSDQNGEQLPGMKEFWKYAPSGGELASSAEVEYYFGEGFSETMKLLEESHTTFIGPHGGAKIEEEALAAQIDEMSREMGYCFQIKHTVLKKKLLSCDRQFLIQIANIGIAPMYEDWPLFLWIKDSQGNTVREQSFSLGLTELLPGEKEISLTLKDMKLPGGEYTIEAGFIDPMTGRPGIRLANGNETEECTYKIMEFTIK